MAEKSIKKREVRVGGLTLSTREASTIDTARVLVQMSRAEFLRTAALARAEQIHSSVAAALPGMGGRG